MGKDKITEKEALDMLKRLKYAKRLISQMEYEIKNYQDVIYSDDIIETMSYHYELECGIKSSKFSDKTVIAALFHNEKKAALSEYKKQLEEYLNKFKISVGRLEYYIGLLDKKQSELITMIYMEDMSINEAGRQLEIPHSTAHKTHRKALSELAEMFSLFSEWTI